MNKKVFPWYFFTEYAKYHALFILVIILGTSLIYRSYTLKWIENHIEHLMFRELEAQAVNTDFSSIQASEWCKQFQTREFEITFTDNSGNNICGKSFSPSDSLIVRKKIGTGELTAAISFLNIQKMVGEIDQSFAFLLGPFLLFVMVFLFGLAIRMAKPLQRVLERVARIESKLPFEEKLGLFYRQNEWSQIEAALTKTEEDIERQQRKLEDEGLKTSTILESIHDAIIAVDYFQNSIFYNDKFYQVFCGNDFSKGEPVKLWKIFSYQKIQDCFKNAIIQNNVQSIRGLKSETDGHYYNLNVGPMRDHEGKLIGAMGVFHDVTESKLTEQMRVDFVANVSHEMRTPLTSIKGFAQVLQSLENDPKKTPLIDKIIHNTDRLIIMFNDLLNLSVIESQNEVHIEKINLSKKIETVKNTLWPIYKDKGMNIKLLLEQEEIWADKKLIEQALINLIDNACKYSQQNGTVTIKTYKQNNADTISVSDDGPGIAQEHIGRIFERFYRVDNSRSNTVKGTGIGLAIVKHIVNKHHGKVWAESQPQHGTTFFIQLPEKH